jgi:uncharacterized integral membrane protein
MFLDGGSMWVIRWILTALFIAFVIGFAMQNTEQHVNVIFFRWQSIDLPLWVVMYLAFIAGMIFWLFVTIYRVIGLNYENHKCRKEISKLQAELYHLRNASVEESILPLESDLKVSKKHRTSQKE